MTINDSSFPTDERNSLSQVGFVFVSIGIILLSLVSGGGNGGCGYHLPSRAVKIPGGAQSIRVEVFRSETPEGGVADLLTDGIKREFIQSGQLKVLTPGEADLILKGVVREVIARAVAFSADGSIARYRLSITAGLELTRASDGKTIWRVERIAEDEEYEVVAGSVEETEQQRYQAMERIVGDLGERIHDLILEDF